MRQQRRMRDRDAGIKRHTDIHKRDMNDKRQDLSLPVLLLYLPLCHCLTHEQANECALLQIITGRCVMQNRSLLRLWSSPPCAWHRRKIRNTLAHTHMIFLILSLPPLNTDGRRCLPPESYAAIRQGHQQTARRENERFALYSRPSFDFVVHFRIH